MAIEMWLTRRTTYQTNEKAFISADFSVWAASEPMGNLWVAIPAPVASDVTGIPTNTANYPVYGASKTQDHF